MGRAQLKLLSVHETGGSVYRTDGGGVDGVGGDGSPPRFCGVSSQFSRDVLGASGTS